MKNKKNKLIAVVVITAIVVVMVISYNNKPAEVLVETEAKAEVSKPTHDSVGRINNDSLDPRWKPSEKPDRPLIVSWESVNMTLSKEGEPVKVVIHFPFVISELKVQEWQKGEISPKSYVGLNPPMNDIQVHKDVSGVQGEWINFEVVKKTPQGLIPRPGLPRFGSEDYTSTHKWVKIQEI